MKAPCPTKQKTIRSFYLQTLLQGGTGIDYPGEFAEVRPVVITTHALLQPLSFRSAFNFRHPVILDRQPNRLAQVARKSLKEFEHQGTFHGFGTKRDCATWEKFPCSCRAVHFGLLI